MAIVHFRIENSMFYLYEKVWMQNFQMRLPRRLQFIVIHVFILCTTFLSKPGFAQDWLQWGGPNGDFTVKTGGLIEKWPDDGPKHLWKRSLGEGYSTILHKNDRLYTMTSQDNQEIVISLDAQTGETIWEHRYFRKFWSDMMSQYGPGPNASPLIVDDKIISVGIAGQLRGLKLSSGKLLWKRDLPAEFGRRKRMEEYGYSASPLLYHDSVIVQVGGDEYAVIAMDPQTGSIRWKSDPGGVSYAQASIIKLAGQDQYIYFSPEGINGLDPSTGKLLWHFIIPVDNGNHLTPIVQCDENHIFVSSQFDSGCGRLLKITNENNIKKVKQIWFDSKLQGSCWTNIRIDDYIFGSAGGHNISGLVAFEWRTGKINWYQRRYRMAQCLYADGKLLFLVKSGKLSIAKVSPTEVDVLDTAKITSSVSWTPPTLVSTKLFVRDRKHIVALDLSGDIK
jgi:outer membrane protein assembly factor BamB